MELEVTPTAWAVTIAVVLVLLAIDLVVAGRGGKDVTFRAAVGWSIFYVGVAIAFGFIFAGFAGWGEGTEYFAGYIVEKSLSVDNLFVFVIIMATFAVPAEHQKRVLTFGIILALVIRAIFIAIGATLLSLFSFMFAVFGLLLIVTAIQLFRHRDQDPSVDDNVLVTTSKRVLPMSDEYDEGKLVTTDSEGKRRFTPLFLVLIAIGSTDVLFALDSIPAVFGVTDDAYIVFTANAFALIGLRALYFLVAGLLDRLVYLSVGLSGVLLFIGVKLILEYAHKQNKSFPEISIGFSLTVIVSILTVTTIASVIKARRDPTARAHAGSLRGHSSQAQPEPEAG